MGACIDREAGGVAGPLQSVCNVSVPLTAFDDALVVMTATDASGNTSESGCFGIGPVFAAGFEE